MTNDGLLESLRGLIAAPDHPSALASYRSALAAWLAGPHGDAWYQTLFGVEPLWKDYVALDERRHTDLAIEFYEGVQKSEPRGLRLPALVRLGVLYAQRPGAERAENLEKAIAYSAEAVKVAEKYRDELLQPWAAARVNLGHAYLERLRGDLTENIEIALGHYRVLSPELLVVDPLVYGRAEHSLAVAFRRRRRGDSGENLNLAMFHALAAEDVLTPDLYMPDWANVQVALGVLFYLDQGGDRQKKLHMALSRYLAALRVSQQRGDTQLQANIEDKLGSAYSYYTRGDRLRNLNRAMRHYQRALALRRREDYPRDWAKTLHNIAATHADFVALGQRDHLPQAIALYQQALAMRSAEAFPADHLQTQRNLGHLYFAEGRWAEAAQAFQSGLAASELIYQEAASEEAQQEELRESAGLPALLAYSLLRAQEKSPTRRALEWLTGQAAPPSPLEAAVLALEKGRARTWAEALALTTASLANVPPELRRDLVETRRELRELQAQARLPDDLTPPAAAQPPVTSFVKLSAQLRACRRKLAGVVARIRAVNPVFLPDPGLAEVREAARQTPLVYIATTPQGSLALIVRCPEKADAPLQVEPLWANHFSSAALSALASRYLSVQTDPPALQATLAQMLPILGAELVAPLADALRERAISTFTLIPLGLLGVLPLHAAPYTLAGQRFCLLDEFTVAYAPSARALAAAQRQARARQGETISLVGVGNPLHEGARPLPQAKAELEGITLLLQGYPGVSAQPLYGARADLANLTAALSGATVAHFACHGLFHAASPLDSALLLAGTGRFTLRGLLATDPAQLARLQLVTLSACQTMLSDVERVPDEVIGLPAGFLQAGVPAVIGSLWPVYSHSAALLMLRCYEIMWRDPGHPPVKALRLAQLWLRDLTYQELDEYAKILARRAKGVFESTDWYALTTDCQGMAWQAEMRGAAGERPFADAIHWAAFAYNGAMGE